MAIENENGVSATSDSKDRKISEVPHLENVTGVEKIPVSAAGGVPRYVEVKQIVEKAVETANEEGVEASKLKTPVMLWGNEFDGSGDVEGDIILKNGRIIRCSQYSSEEGLTMMRYFFNGNFMELGEEVDNLYIYPPTQFNKNITAPNITVIENILEGVQSALKGVTKAADESEVVKGIFDADGGTIFEPMDGNIPIDRGDGIVFDEGSINGNKVFVIKSDTDYLATREYVDSVKTSILGSEALNESYDTLQEVAEWIESHSGEAAEIISDINDIQSKLEGVTHAADKSEVVRTITFGGSPNTVTPNGLGEISLTSSKGIKISGSKYEIDVSPDTDYLATREYAESLIENSRTPIETPSGTTLIAEVGKFYRYDNPVDTLAIMLPNVAETDVMQTLEVMFETGNTPQVTIDGNGAEVEYFSGYSIVPGKKYEINILWNGVKWVVAYGTIE